VVLAVEWVGLEVTGLVLAVLGAWTAWPVWLTLLAAPVPLLEVPDAPWRIE